MPYREVARPAACHPSLPAFGDCADCRREICESCLRFDAVVPRCQGCVARARRHRRRRRVAGAIAVVFLSTAAPAVVAVVVDATSDPRLHPPREIEWQSDGLRVETRCTPIAASAVVDDLLLRKPRAALAFLRHFEDECPWQLALSLAGPRFAAHRALGQPRAALDVVEGVLATAPRDDFLRFWHIAALEEAGDLAAADRELGELARDVDSRRWPVWRQPVRLAKLPLAARGFRYLPLRIATFFHAHNRDCHGASAVAAFSAWFPTIRHQIPTYRNCGSDGFPM